MYIHIYIPGYLHICICTCIAHLTYTLNTGSVCPGSGPRRIRHSSPHGEGAYAQHGRPCQSIFYGGRKPLLYLLFITFVSS